MRRYPSRGRRYPPPPRAAASGVETVSTVVGRIRSQLEGSFGGLRVRGEATDVRRSRGHVFFCLRDREAALKCVIWRRTAEQLSIPIEQGKEIIASGRISVWEKGGDFRLDVSRLELAGEGERERRLEELKKKLAAEGLFAEARKRPLPFLPRRIGVVTSREGAALHDVLSTIERRCPSVRVLLAPVRVQGDEAAREIANAIRLLGGRSSLDLLIVGRGGGSRDDLRAFDEEVVARAIADSPLPVISAVGHETDVSVADLVADRRAATPTGAAEMAVPDGPKLVTDLDLRRERLEAALQRRLDRARELLAGLGRRHAVGAPRARLGRLRERTEDLGRRLGAILRDRVAVASRRRATLDGLAERLARSARLSLAGARRRAEATGKRLEAISPLAVLDRGYAIATEHPGGRILKDPAELADGQLVRVRLAGGIFTARVVDLKDGSPSAEE